MLEAFFHMLWPLLACLVLVGIHAYLGIHVIARKVIFVDLALAQIAALGAVYGVLLGFSFETNSLIIKLISTSFTLIGALLCSLTKVFDKKVPHEALIGIIYASALSMTFLLTSHLPHGKEEVELMLTGNILWVTPKEVIYTALLYILIGFIHVIFRKKFFSPHATPFWDFCLYATFGVVVTSSVGMGGVLLVFGYLVIPSVIGILLASSNKNRLLWAWFFGILASILGVVISYYLDLPSGPTIVVLLSLLLAIILLVTDKNHKYKLWFGFIALLFLLFLFLLPFYYTPHRQEISSKEDIIEILEELKISKPREIPTDILALLYSTDHQVRSKVIELIRDQKYPVIPELKKAYRLETDDFIKLEIATTILALGDPSGFLMLRDLVLLKDDLVREDVFIALHEWIDSGLSDEKMLELINSSFNKISFDKSRKKYFFKD